MRCIFGALGCLALMELCVMSTCGGAAAGQEPNHGFLLVANKGDRSLSIIDATSGLQLAAVPVGGTTGHEVAASPDGQVAWVPIYGDSGVGQPGTDGRTISIIDLKARIKVGEIDLGSPSRPHHAVFGPKDGRLYVTSELTHSIQVIDPAKRKVIASIPTGAPESHMLAISSSGERGYTSNVAAGSVSVIDLHAGRLVAVIPVAKTVQRIAISGDGRWVFTADQSSPRIAVIDTQTNAVRRWIALPDLGYGMAAARDGSRLLVTHPASNTVSVIDLHSMDVIRTIRVPANPQEILIRPDNRVAYVSCDESKQVAAIDLAAESVKEFIDAGNGADGLAWVTTQAP
jgi:YVTN family beta-propeller protein